MIDSVYLESLRTGLEPPDRSGIIGFGEKYVKFPHSDRAPRFIAKTAPWLVEPLLELTDNANVEVVCRASVGSSKTTMFETALPYIIAEDPGPTMVVTQTDDDTKDWADTRLKGVLQACDPVRELIPASKAKMKKEMMMFPHMFVALGGANLSSLQSKSIRWCLGDEVWLWPDGMLEEFRGRRHDRWNARMFLVSQGGVKGDEFSQAYGQTDQRIRHWICPKCKHRQPYLWTQVKWDDYWVNDEEGGEMDFNRIGDSVHLQCDSCNARYHDLAKNRRDLSLKAEYVISNPNAMRGYVGFWWNALSVYWIPWRVMVVQWLKAMRLRKDGDEEAFWKFKQKRLAEDRDEAKIEDRVELVGSGYLMSEIDPGSLVDGELYRFLTADKQIDHYWVVIRAWRKDGSSRLLYAGRVNTEEGIQELERRYKVTPRLVGIDAQYDTPVVYQMCARHDWTALHGSKESGFKHFASDRRKKPTVKYVSRIAKASVVGKRSKARYMFWSNEKIKDILFQLRQGRGVSWELGDDISQDYLKQIDSEKKTDIINKTTKQVEQRWVRIYKHNHLWDCECEQVVLAYSLGVLGDFYATVDDDEEKD